MISASAPRRKEPPTPKPEPSLSKRRLLGLPAALLVCAIGAALISQGRHHGLPNWLFLAGAAIAAGLLGKPAPAHWNDSAGNDSATCDRSARSRARAGIAIALIGALSLAAGTVLLIREWDGWFDRCALAIVIGVVLSSVGLTLWERARAPLRLVGKRFRAWEVLVLVAILAIGVGLRLHRYDEFPPADGFSQVEEAQVGLWAHGILLGERPWEFMLDKWLAVPSFALWGENPTALRVPFTIVSCATILALYGLLRQLVSIPAALLTAAFFAVARWPLIYARYAHFNWVYAPVVVVLLHLCVRADRQALVGRGLGIYPWIGFLTANTAYAYAGYRATPLFVCLYFLLSILRYRRVRRPTLALRTEAAGLAISGSFLLMLALPLVALLSRDRPHEYFEAIRRARTHVNILAPTWSELARDATHRMIAMLRIFNQVGDENPSFNLPGEPMFDPVLAALLTLGVAFCLIWARHRMQGFFAFMLLVLVLVATVMMPNLDFTRLYGPLLLMFVPIAFVVDRLLVVSKQRSGKRGIAVATAIGLAGLGVTWWDSYRLYFKGMFESPVVRANFQDGYTVAIRYLHGLPSGAYMVLVADMDNFFSDNDYDWWRGDRVPGRVSTDLAPFLEGRRGEWTGREIHALIADPYRSLDLERQILERLPGSVCTPYAHPDSLQLELTACRLAM